MDTETTGTAGLSASQAAALLLQHGPNELQREDPPSPLHLLLEQLRSPLVLLLIGATALSAALGEVADAVAIGVIVVLNATVGFLQEYRAERALLALRALTAPRASVIRDGRRQVIPAADVVPGDLLTLEGGDRVAADGVLLEAHALTTEEAALTGESQPVLKRTTPAPDDAPLAEQVHRVYAGTSVASGTGLARVAATGMNTEMGRVAGLLATAVRGKTPLQVRLEAVSRTLIWLCLGVVAAVGALGLWRGEPWLDVLLASVSLAVAAVPEGLPAVVTIALAVGVQRLSARGVLVRRLHAVETLGAITVICTDKTGTLTTGNMAVRAVSGVDPRAVLRAATLCSDAELGQDGVSGVGDPTEVAILAAAAQEGLRREELERAAPRRQVYPFDSVRKRMGVARADGHIYVKGAAESVLPLCPDATEAHRAEALALAGQGLRVLAVAEGEGSEERGLRFLGYIGLADPPRPEAKQAVADARGAGIRPVMITGDHPVTASAIARELGVMRGDETAEDRVHARVTPEDKLDIVRRWKSEGEVVAMTGDGVNDAPAIREAHIGIAMGKGGTEVAREAADLVLTDDNFASIVAGVREGRTIYDNIRKTLVYLLAGNAAELGVMFGASLAGLPLPFLPIQLLWINLVTDGLPALALVVDPPDQDTLRRPPRDPEEAMLGRRQGLYIVASGLVEAAVVLGAFAVELSISDFETARTVAFTTLVYSELFRAFAARSPDRVLWEVGAWTNGRLLAVVALSGLTQVGLWAWPAAAGLFGLHRFDASTLALCVGLALIPVTVLELGKLVRRMLRREAQLG